jgi:threonine dehydratase
MSIDVNLDAIEDAARRIKGRVARTPLKRSRTLGDRLGCNVYVKFELFQKTGSFKPRGAFNKLLSTPEHDRGSTAVAVSGGNHGQAVAFVARELGMHATILMPESTPRNYVEATLAYGAEVLLRPNVAVAFEEGAEMARRGGTFVHPFDDPLVIAGQGTVGLEIFEDAPQLTDVVISIGGGGFAGGVATALKARNSALRIWGVETEGADAMARALAAGRVVQLPEITSIAKTLGAPAVSERTLEIAQRHLENVTVVADAEAVREMRFLLERLKVLTEPAASCTLAAAERLRAHFSPASHVCLVLCGGNISADDFCRFTHDPNLMTPS